MLRALQVLTRRELLRLRRNPQAILTGLLLPILYLLLFGQAFNLGRLFTSSPGGAAYLRLALLGAPNYFSYFSVGMVGFVAVTATLFTGANVIFDKLFGILKRITATSAPASAIFGARLLAGALQPILLALFVLGLAIGLGHVGGLSGLDVTSSVTVVGALEILVAITLLAVMFTSLFVSMGFVFEQPQTYFAAVNALNLPVLFTSDALYPWGTMPPWLQNIATYNPVTLTVSVMRENLFPPDLYPHPAWVYLGGLAVWAAVMIAIAILLVHRALAPKK
ncbi:MAG: ABC transporter permease [Thermoplasmata archaeon]|nr:ABC transporter permease [Thermoplasmata archaeon]